MRRPILLTATTILTVIVLLTLNSNAGAATSCGNSFPDDGFAGPHWRSINGGTMYGNTVKITCPSGSTSWSVTYRVQGSVVGSGVWVNQFSATRTGTGSTQFSISQSPIGCNPNDVVYRTHVENNVTGGTINKPSGGVGVHLTC